MFEKSEKFPEGWFFIKNNSNGYVLMVDNESQESGSPIVLATLRTKDYASQLWRHDPSGYLVNKKSGQVMDIAKGTPKAGVDIVQQTQAGSNVKDDLNFQKFGLSPYGHIYLANKPSLILGIKESFFARREGLHVHLQLVDKRHLDRKEQRWDFVLPVVKEASAEPLKRSASSSTVKSTTASIKVPAVAQIKEDDARSVHSTAESTCSSIDHADANTVPTGSFPDTAFFLKSDASGLYISIENETSVTSGTQLTIDGLRKRNYDSQLWTYDAATHRIVNKFSGLVLGIERNAIKDGSDIIQTTSSAAEDRSQAWILSPEGEITLKSNDGFVLGFKESWFGSREGAHLHLQKRNKGHQHQKFTVVLPIFKKSTETTAKTEQRGVFPDGWFFVKSQARGLVLTVLETGVIAAEVAATKLDTSNYSRQLWKYSEGYIINKASNMVLDVRGGSIENGASICQYTRKEKDNKNQQWALTPEGVIYLEVNRKFVLTVKESEAVRSKLYLSERKAGHKEQCWNFVLPVFKKKQTASTAITKINTFRYATYPSGWFFIRSFVSGSTTESPLVLTAKDEKSIKLTLLDREHWQHQLWTYSSGRLINYATDLSIDISSASIGAGLIQSKSAAQKWYMTTDGYLIYGQSDDKLALSVETQDKNKYRLTVCSHKYSQELRWGFLIPKFGYRSGVQTLSQWSIAILREWRTTTTTTTTTTKKFVHQPVAEWPQGEFYISGPDGHALAPEKSESGSALVMKKLEITNESIFKWTFRNGYLVHCATGLVMRAQDNFAQGGKLQLSTEVSGDLHQSWTLRTDGTIISKKDEQFGLGLVQVNGSWTIQIVTTSYYAWRILYGRYETRYSEQEKREISYLVSFQRIVLTLWTIRKHDDVERKLVTHSYGVFPKGWVFIRSKCDDSLLITVSDKKKGAKLILSKLDSKIYRRQLWRYREDGCLVNFDTDYVIDVAGGKLFSNANIIQWSPKFLRSSRKNQMWSLSVHGHIHPRSNSDLVLSSIGNHTKEGAELKLIKRGDLSLDYQQWSFATPVFSKCTHTTFAAQQAHKDSLVFEKIGSSCSIAESSSERYERVTKKTIVRRWGVFPEGGFFIRCTHGSKNLALTVERDESTSQYRIVIRSLNFKAYKWQFWTYSNGYLINEQTGLVLDAQFSEDVAIEGEQSQVYLKEKASNEGQFWDLGVNGEIHLRSNERLTIGVAGSGDASVEGAQVGIRKVRIERTNVDGKQVSTLKSDAWLRWSFSKPVFGKRAGAAVTTEGEASLEIEKCEEHAVAVKEQDEVLNDEEAEEEEEKEEEEEQEEAEGALKEAADDSDFEIQTPVQTPSSSSNTSASAAGVAIVTAGTVVAVAAGTTANVVTSSATTEEKATIATVTAVESTAKTDIVATVETPAKVDSTTSAPSSPVLKKSDSARSQKLTRKDSFQLEENYIPTGFEKIVRYKSHHGGYPSGYFFIKSSLHGYVLDVVGDVKEGSHAVLTRMKSTDFASQMWSFQNGFLVNLKGRVLVLDAANAALVAGERVHLATRNSKAEGFDDQIWEYSAEGYIHLKSKRSFVLSLKETKRSDKYTEIDVYVQEAKALVKKQARPEQHWEILVPALIPVSQGESGVKIIESGKVEKVTSSASAIISYKWLKETYCHKVTAQNQWPGTEGWFFIRFGSENHFLASGDSAQSQVGLYELAHELDYRRFLWTYIDGYLINYRYMLRLVLSTSHRWILSNSHSTLNQKFYIHANGSISVRISKIIYYIRFIRTKSGAYTLDVTSDNASKETQGLELHIPVISDAEYQKKSVLAISSANAWIRKQKSDWSILTSTTVRRGVFPASAWFFIKATYKGSDELVLSVQESSSQLVLKKLDFKSFKHQLWTYNDGLLINYGSKFVIDVQGSVAVKSSIVHAAEAGVSTQKWYLTAEGRIELDSHDFYVLGCDGFKDGAHILLGSSRTSSSVKIIQWRFSTPIFGKRATATTATTTVTDITKEIENGAIIEGAKEVESTNKSQLALTRRTTKHSYVIYRESRLIIRWWRIIFIRRLSTCRTQKEYLEVIEQYRQILYSRFAQYLEVYGSSVTKEERIALEASIEETKATLETEVFTKSTTYLKTLKSDEEVSSKQLDVSAIVTGCCHSIDKKYEAIITKNEKEAAVTKDTTTTTTVSSGQQVVKHYESEAEAVDGVLVVVDTIQITIRYWFRTLYGRISEASKKGAKKEEIDILIKDSQKDLQSQLTKISETTSTSLSGSVTLSEEYKKTFEKSVTAVIEKSKSEIDHFVSNVDVSTVTTVDNWNKLTGAIDNTLSLKFHECKNTVQEVDVVQEIENKKEESVQVTEEEVESSKLEIVTTLAESKAYIISWFTNIYKDISWSVESSSSTKEDTLTIVDAAELDIISKIDESVALLSVLSSSLTYLSWTERRRLVTYYISMKTYLLANLKRFRVSIADSDKESILKICQSSFSEQEQTDILKNIDYILENVSVTTTTTTTTTASGAIVAEEKENKAVDIIVKDTESVAVGVISGSDTISQVEAITKQSGTISTGIVHGETETSSKVNVVTDGSESVTVGVVSGKIIDKKETSSIETDATKSTSATIDVIETETSSSTVAKDTEIDTIHSGKNTESTTADKVTDKAESHIATGVASGIVVGVAAGIAAEVISHGKDSSSKVDIVTKDSESVTVGVIQDTTSTTQKDTSASVDIVVGSISSEIGLDTTNNDTATIGIITGEKNTTTSATNTTECDTVTMVTGKKDTTSKTEGSAVGIVVAGSSSGKIDVTTEESGSVTIVAGEKETTTTTTETVEESSSIDIVSGEKDTITKTEGSAVGIVVAGGSSGKIDVTTEESGSVTIIAGEKETTTTTTETVEESSSIDIVSGEKDTITKTEGSAVGVVVAGGSSGKIDVTTEESGSVTIVAGEKDTTTTTTETVEESSSIDIVSGEKNTITKVEGSAVGVVVAGGSCGKIGVTTEESGSVTIIAGEKDTTTTTTTETVEESSSIDIVSGEKDTITKTEGSAVGIVVTGGSSGKIDVTTEESGSVTIVAGEKDTTTTTTTETTEESSSIDIVSGEKDTITKTEGSAVGIVVAGGSSGKIDVTTEESGSVTIIAGEKDTTTTTTETVEESSSIDIVSGEKDTITKTESSAVGIVVAGGSSGKIDVTTEESGSVTIVAGEKDTTTTTTTETTEESSSIDIVSGEKNTITKTEGSAVGIVVAGGSSGKIDVTTEESGSVTVIAGEKDTTTTTTTETTEESSSIDIVSGEKDTITKTEGSAVGVVVAGGSSGKIDVTTEESGSVTIVAGEKDTTTTTTTETTEESSSIDIVSGEKDTITKTEGSAVGIVVAGGSSGKIDVTTEESGSVTIIAGEKDTTTTTTTETTEESSSIDIVSGEKDTITKTEGSAVGVVVAGGSSGKIDVTTEESGSVTIVAGEKDTTTTTTTETTEESSSIDIVSGEKDTITKTEGSAVGVVVAGGSSGKIDVTTEESGSVTVIAGEKDTTTTTTTETTEESSSIDIVSGEKNTITKTEGSAVGIVVAGGSSGKIDVTTEESGSVTIIAGEKDTTTTTTETVEESSSIDIVSGEKDTITKTESSAVGIVVAGGSSGKIDVTTEESGSVTIVAGEKDTTTTTTTETTEESSSIDIVSGEKNTITKTEGSAVGIVVAGGSSGKIDVTTEESGSVTIIAGEKDTTTTTTTETTEEPSSIDIVSGEKDTITKTEGSAVGVVVAGGSSGKIDVTTEESGSVTIVAGEKDTTTTTTTETTEESSSIDIVSGEKDTITKTEGSAVGVVVAGGSSGKIDVTTEESGSVTIIAGEKDTTTTTTTETVEESSSIDIVSGEKNTITKTEGSAVGIVVTGGSSGKIDVTTEESGSVTIVAGEKDTTTTTTTETTEESSSIDIVSGEKDTITKTEGSAVGIVVAGGSSGKIDVTTEESGSVTIIAGEKDTTTTTTTETTEESSSIDIVSGEKDTITKTEGSAVGVVVAGGSSGKIDVTTEESGSVTIVAGEKDTTTTTTETTEESSSIDIVSGEKDTITKVEGSAVGIVVAGGSSGKIEESGSVTIISGEKDTTTTTTETVEESSSIDIVSGEKDTITKTEDSAVGIVVTGGSSGKIDVTTEESGSVTIVAGEKDTTTTTTTETTEESSSIDIVSGEKDTITKTEGSAVGVVVAGGSSGKIDVTTEESGSVTIVAGEKDTTTTTTTETTEESSSIDIVSGEKNTITKTEGSAVGIVVAGGSSGKIDVTTEESGSVTVIAGEKDTTTTTTTETTEESSSIDIVSGEKDTITKTEGSAVGVVVAGGSCGKIGVTTEESGSVTIIAGEKDTTTTTTETTEESSSIDIVSGEKDTITKVEGSAVGIVVAGGSSGKIEESGSVTIISGEKTTVLGSDESDLGTKVGGGFVSNVDVVTGESSSITVVTGGKDVCTKTEGSAIVVGASGSEKINIISKESDTEAAGTITVVSKDSDIDTAVKETESLVIGEAVKEHESVSKTTVVGGVAVGVVAGVVAGVIAGSSSGSVSVDDKKSASASDKIVIVEDTKTEAQVGQGQASISIVESEESETGVVVVGGETKTGVTGEVVVGVIGVDQGKKISGVDTVYVSKDSHLYTTEVCANYEKVTDSVYGWFARFVEKVTSMLEVGDCAEDVEAVIVQEKAKLQVIIEESQQELSSSSAAVVSSNSREWSSFYKKLQGSIESQVSSIKSSVDECYAEGGDVKTHHIDVHAIKEDFKKAVALELSVAKVEVYEVSKSNATKVQVGQAAGDSEIVIDVSKSSQQVVKQQEVVYESVEHAQEETKKVLTCAVGETQKKLAFWYDILFGKIRSIRFSSAAAYKQEVDVIVAGALEEAAVIIKESKSSVEFKYSVSGSCSTEVASTVEVAQKQALESLDSIYVIVTEQVSAIQEIASTADAQVIQEKITIVEEQSRRKTQAALEITAETAVSAGFEGKTVTWVETAQIPASFKDVKVFAFDVVDTIVNYRLTISKAWYQLVAQKKNSCTLSHIDVDAFVIRWYALYLEQRLKAKHSEMDIYVLIAALKLVLAEFCIESSFTETELKTLSSAWLHLELFEDASASIRKIKQLEGVYAIAISHAFTIRTMMDLARSGCLCWHAQFTADMFAACTINNGTSTEVTVVSNTAMLLGLEKASELAVISSNPEILEAAKAYGSKTVSLNRFATGKKEHSFDIEFDGLDIFAESFETFYEAKVLSTTTKVEVPVSRSWFQRVVSTVTTTAESVSHAIIG